MYMFDLNRPIAALIHIKDVHSSLSYQLPTYPKYDRRGHELPRGYGPLLNLKAFLYINSLSHEVSSISNLTNVFPDMSAFLDFLLFTHFNLK